MGNDALHNALLVIGVFAQSFEGVMVWFLLYLTNCFLGSGPIVDVVLWNGKIFCPHVRLSVPPLGHLARLEAQPTRPEAEPTRPEAK